MLLLAGGNITLLLAACRLQLYSFSPELDRFATPSSCVHPSEGRLPCLVMGDLNLNDESPVYTFWTEGYLR